MRYNKGHVISHMEKDMSEKLVMMKLLQSDYGEHDHQFFELAYVTKGTVEHNLNENRCLLKAGDYFFIDYGSFHSFEKSKNLELINCLFLPEFIDETLQGCESLDELLHASMVRFSRQTVGQTWADRIFHDEDGKIGNLLLDMIEEYNGKHLGSSEILRLHLKEILIHTFRTLTPPADVYTDSTVNEVIRFVDEGFYKQISLQQFCTRKHYNLSYISRKFKEETGMTFRNYVQKVRIEKSCDLLAGSDMAVNEISRAVGYEDIQFFNSIFKKMLHMTPTEYRKRSV